MDRALQHLGDFLLNIQCRGARVLGENVGDLDRVGRILELCDALSACQPTDQTGEHDDPNIEGVCERKFGKR